MSKKDGDDIWSNLEFDDDDCSKINFNDKGWKTMELPNLWESTDLGEFDGAIWFRKKFLGKIWYFFANFCYFLGCRHKKSRAQR